MKRILSLALVLVLVLSMAACAPKAPAPAVKPPQATGFLDELGVATDDIFGKEDAR